ncbi:F6A14.12 PROTEIN-RELATED [Salix purpurea]|uniref:RING-type E3 ubiquitin transferase n=1 Tax=Salix purpurea TaxID=77065 RepID=A0A9Q0V4E9_SALPP|nr:F6A14.12 PROTEIN-RELATED [Salix purpurea]
MYNSLHGEEFFATDRRPESISRKTIHIPVGDSPCHHIDDFNEILTDMGIHEIKRSEILHEIATKAHGIDTRGGLYMLVIIRKTVYGSIRFLNEEDDIARAQRESMGAEARPIPATKSSIDALERVVFDVSASAGDCAVCLEEISAGSEAIPMPCSHVYHSDCIVKWLQTSHSCPLCRYNMPFE